MSKNTTRSFYLEDLESKTVNFPSQYCAVIQTVAQHMLCSLKRTWSCWLKFLSAGTVPLELASVHGQGVHPVRTHCSITLLCKKGFSAECFRSFSGKNEDILWLSALSGDTRTICASWVHIAVMESTKIWLILKKKRRNSVDMSLYFVPQSYCDVICKTQPNFFFQEFSESLSFTLTCHHSPTNTCMNSRFHGEPLAHFLAIDSRAQPARFHSFLGVHVQMKRA